MIIVRTRVYAIKSSRYSNRLIKFYVCVLFSFFFFFYHSVRIFVAPDKIFFVFPPLNVHFCTHSETSVSLTGSGGKINSTKLNVIYVRHATCMECLSLRDKFFTNVSSTIEINRKNKRTFQFLNEFFIFSKKPNLSTNIQCFSKISDHLSIISYFNGIIFYNFFTHLQKWNFSKIFSSF